MKYLIGFIFLSISMLANSASDQWTAKVKVLEIYTGYKGNNILFKTSGDQLNPNECSDTSLYSVEPSNADIQSILSTLLAAKMAGIDVKVAVDGDRCGTSDIDHVKNKPSISRVGIF